MSCVSHLYDIGSSRRSSRYVLNGEIFPDGLIAFFFTTDISIRKESLPARNDSPGGCYLPRLSRVEAQTRLLNLQLEWTLPKDPEVIGVTRSNHGSYLKVSAEEFARRSSTPHVCVSRLLLGKLIEHVIVEALLIRAHYTGVDSVGWWVPLIILGKLAVNGRSDSAVRVRRGSILCHVQADAELSALFELCVDLSN